MKNLAKSILTLAVSLTSLISFGQTVVLDNQVFTNDTTIRAQTVICKENGKIRVRFGKTLTITTDVIEVETNFIIDGRGEPGVDGAPMGDWRSSPGCGGWEHNGHAQWETAKYDGVTGGAKGNDGSDGFNGASIYINFNIYQGQTGGLGGLICQTNGGIGGRGGKGITLHCGCGETGHASESFTKPYGNSGKNGITGKYLWKFIKQ